MTNQPAHSATTPQPVKGTEAIKEHLRNLGSEPGVYRMLDAEGTVLYVGKAINLKRRVQSYINMSRHTQRIKRMIASVVAVETTTTRTEAEALLLESTLIKRLRPKYNVLLRDDKSFPFIHFSSHDTVRLRRHRGSRTGGGDFFGPFVSSLTVNHTLIALQRAFGLRTCADSILANRSRPCLLFQIHRCSGPCTGEISADDYRERVKLARDFLSGRSDTVLHQIQSDMYAASDKNDFELASVLRDRLSALGAILSQQSLQASNMIETDLFALVRNGISTCIQVFFFRHGMNWGNHPYFLHHSAEETSAEIMEAFLGQFYASRHPAREILVSIDMPSRKVVQSALRLRRDSGVEVRVPRRGGKVQLMQLALRNAEQALATHKNSRESSDKQRLHLAKLAGLDRPPERIEVYDNSHLRGDQALGVMIVAGVDGFEKSAYRKFSIKSAAREDDYAMMEEVLLRRFKPDRARTNSSDAKFAVKPDLLVIDGGQGQLNRVVEVLKRLSIEDVPVVAIAKGRNRREDIETLYRIGEKPTVIKAGDAALHFLQNIRDEAHRFAIGALRSKRRSNLTKSAMDEIPGIGTTRKKKLLQSFGNVRKLATASLMELQSVDGISAAIAQSIWDYFHEQK